MKTTYYIYIGQEEVSNTTILSEAMKLYNSLPKGNRSMVKEELILEDK